MSRQMINPSTRSIFIILLFTFLFGVNGCQEGPSGNKQEGQKQDQNEEGQGNPGGAPAVAKNCTFAGCVLQEISIASMARNNGRIRYFYNHTKTEVTPINADGTLNENASVAMNPANPGGAPPGVAQLVQQIEAALNKNIQDHLNLNNQGRGSSVHGFGCADECKCEKRFPEITLPNGNKVPNPGQVVNGGLPPGPNAVPGNQQPLVTVEKRVTLPGQGTFLITYEVRIYGTVTRFRGDCC